MVLGKFRCILNMSKCKVGDEAKAFHVPFLAVAVLSEEDPDPINLGKAMLNVLNVEHSFGPEYPGEYGKMLLAGGVCVQDGLGGVMLFDNWEDFEKKYRLADSLIEA